MKLFYLLNLGVYGIKNIDMPVQFSFYKKTIQKDFDPQLYQVKAIYGENGSGKTAIITAVQILKNVLLNKNYLTDSVTQRMLTENINKKIRKAFIEVEFYSMGKNDPYIYRYRIDFEIRSDQRTYIAGEIMEQKLGHYSKNKFATIFKTEHGRLEKGKDDLLYKEWKDKTLNLLDQRSIVTFCSDSSQENDLKDFEHHMRYSFPLMTMWLLLLNTYIYIDGEDNHWDYVFGSLLQNLKTNTSENIEKSLYNLMMERMKIEPDSDPLIRKGRLPEFQKRIMRMGNFIRIFKPSLQGIDLETREYDEHFYKYRLIMIYDGYRLDAEFESRGIRKLMDLFDALERASEGEIVFIDELDSNINDVYLDKMIEYFIYYGKGQLCFTAHNLSPMSVLKDSKCAISFISNIHTVHTWTSNGNMNPENAYRNGFIEDSPMNVDATDFLGIFGEGDE